MPESEVKRNISLLERICQLPRKTISFHIRRRKTKLNFENIPVSVKCIRSNHEIKVEIPEFSKIKANNIGPARITGTVIDSSASCCYPVEFTIKAKTNKNQEVSSIYCFESLFAEFLKTEEIFEAYGILQEIIIKNEPNSYRLVLGTRELEGKEYLRRKG